jgi:anthranilate synthase component 2
MSAILLLDNYDSFTYNVLHLIQSVTSVPVHIHKNDKILLTDVQYYDKIIISPGPDLPVKAGITNDVIRQYSAEKPILGVCLGHQAIGEVFGARLRQLDSVVHGQTSEMVFGPYPGKLFKDVPNHFKAGRYHSWVIDESTLPSILRVTARDEAGDIMAIEHAHYPVFGVQFHPESFMTSCGKQIMCNFLQSDFPL